MQENRSNYGNDGINSKDGQHSQGNDRDRPGAYRKVSSSIASEFSREGRTCRVEWTSTQLLRQLYLYESSGSQELTDSSKIAKAQQLYRWALFLPGYQLFKIYVHASIRR
jgi:hypothetical protein